MPMEMKLLLVTSSMILKMIICKLDKEAVMKKTADTGHSKNSLKEVMMKKKSSRTFRFKIEILINNKKMIRVDILGRIKCCSIMHLAIQIS